MKKLIVLISISLISCLQEFPTGPELSSDLNETRDSIPPPKDSIKSKMNGVYEVLEGMEILGSKVAARWVNNSWCIYSEHDAVYLESAGGFVNELLQLNGYIRQVRSGRIYKLTMHVLKEEGGLELKNNNVPQLLIFRGETTDGQKIKLKRIRNLNSNADSYNILAHRGGGRNAERLGFSENSIEMILHAEILGANGVEIDVKRTKDGQLILFHDDTFSPRTVQGAYLLGRVENFDLNQIKLFGKLINGETIPTLSEALTAIIDSTELNTVWLDLKDPNSVDETITIQKKAMDYALTKNHNIRILLGIPSQEVLDSYLNSNFKNTTPVLIELGVEKVLSDLISTCKVWAPRWTKGIQKSEISNVRSTGRDVFVWTLDVRDFIEDFLNESEASGILSNYPSLVAGMNYSKE